VLEPGTPLRVRVLLANFRSSAPVPPVEFSFPVPADASGEGSLDIFGASDGGGDDDEEGSFSGDEDSGGAGSFKALLASLRDAPRNDELEGTLSLFGGGGGEGGGDDIAMLSDEPSPSLAPVTVTKRLAEVVTGSLSIPVAVPGDEDPQQPSEPPALDLGGKSKLKLATALRKGLRMTVTSSTPGALVARAYVDKKTARRLKINKHAKHAVVVASVAKVIGEGRSHVTLKFTRKAKKRLRHAKRVKLTLRASITDLEGNRATDRAKLVLKRRLH
jgi:hypothetical protein